MPSTIISTAPAVPAANIGARTRPKRKSATFTHISMRRRPKRNSARRIGAAIPIVP
jgi:hypothetical protein